jgi:uncharacterized protein (DUF736 family)
MINLTGLWKHTSKNGTEYLSGRIGGAKVMIFPVKDKKSDKSPDYTLCLTEFEKREDGASTPPASKPMNSEPTFTEDDIPF